MGEPLWAHVEAESTEAREDDLELDWEDEMALYGLVIP